ncbi:saccharopine dehydrogenase NADP-binding domain-containing protein [Streptomyces caniscabiei]|uniref:saccharopine dehydrogenase NADP-binding domain-containing protein n=1 Tax=Streptomyces caniscabiei TaxID=2746961 RepID=UPI000A382A41|nr:saccharopine dehydrogenase NADP-binding domain-containing protein [Streptomyces caniscabiei]
MGAGRTVAVFGASGHTGRFVVAELRARGYVPLLVGRNEEKLRALVPGQPEAGPGPGAQGSVRVASVGEPASLDRAFAGADAVVNCAGPFAETAGPVIEAALRAGIPYVDVAAEIEANLDTFAEFGERARAAGVVVVPAMAFFGGLGAFVLTVWLMIRFSLASPALMLEKQGVRKSMSRSVKLVRGSWWRVLGIQLLATIIAWIVASIVVIPFSFAGAALDGDGLSGFLATGGTALGWTYLVISGVGAVIGSTLTFPISAGVTVLLYIDQRIRREALDLELGRAAGLQGYGDAQGATPGS